METERFRLGASPFFTRLVYLHGTWPIALILVLILVAVVLAFAFDSRFAIVALMVVFLIAPLAMAWLWLYWGLRPEYRFNVAWHTLRLDPDGITVTLLKPVYETVDTEIEEPEDGESTAEESRKTREKITGWERGKEMRFERAVLGRYLTGGDGITIPVNMGQGFIAVPRSIFTSEGEYSDFLNQIVSFYRTGKEDDTQRP